MQMTVNPKIEEYINNFKTTIYHFPLDKALEQAELLGLFLRDNDVGIYSLNDIEEYLIDIVYAELLKGGELFESIEQQGIIFLASELYHSGGHTRLMERLATFLDSVPDLFITKNSPDDIIQREKKFFSTVMCSRKSYSSVLEMIFIIVKVLLRYKVIILNTHQEDIYAIVACGLARKINKNIKIHYVNHADHTFSYGSSISDVWYEISAYGIAVDAMRGLNSKKCFLGIPIEIPKPTLIENYKFKNGDLILTAASAFKYRPEHKQSIMPLISALLDKYDKSKLQVIGVNLTTNYWWWKMKLKYWKRLNLSNSLPYEEYLKVTSSAKLYIDSHPFPGGTAFAEQFLQGRLCVGLKSKYSGYTPLESFKKDNVKDVLSMIDSLCEKDIQLMKENVEKKHGYNAVKLNFVKSFSSCSYNNGDSILPELKPNWRVTSIPIKMHLTLSLCKVCSSKAISIYLFKKMYKKLTLSYKSF
ncbi:hypothetical protein AEA42_08410 [Shewanella sp. Sh95]|uniref:hypothetical protein n=1 Tax=Shewanella sp. Sh95 TaxID=1689868 RepID=UPI0006D99A19|nr:hypothetical protein [Shewanella sp. Sh95]KPN77494.1 hypothetical protein AEA42_08410 [Shewanella sp. Sh95]